MPQMADQVTAFTPVARVLPPEEWATVTPQFATFPKGHAIVVVVEDGGPGGMVLAQWGALTVVHVEGLSIDPAAQHHTGVARALISQMVKALVSYEVAEVLTQADSPEVERLITTAGGKKLPGTTWVLPIGEG